MQNVLVTGGAGFIGHHLVNKLLQHQQQNCQVAIIDNMSNKNENFGLDPKQRRDVTVYRIDVRNMAAVLDIVRSERIDTCIHLAAKISVAESMLDPFETMDVNVNGTLSVLNACAANNVENFVFASSAAVYGEPQIIPIPETHMLNPASPYGASKAAGEALVTSFKNSGKIPNATVFRFFNVYGSGQSAQYAGVITRFNERLARGLPPIIYGDGRQTRDFIHVGDVVDAIVRSVNAKVSGTFNLGTGNRVSLNELAVSMSRSYNYHFEPLREDARVGDVKDSCADISAIRRAIEFYPASLVEESLIQLRR